MSGPIKFIKAIIWIAIACLATGTLMEAKNSIGKEAVRAHKKGGVSFKELNNMLVNK